MVVKLWQLLWELVAIRFTQAPLIVADETKTYFQDLSHSATPASKAVADFVADLPLYTIRDTAIGHMLTSDILTLLDEQARLAQLKKDACAKQDFQLAKQRLIEVREVLAQITQLVPSPVPIKPKHVIALLRKLGFNGDLLPND